MKELFDKSKLHWWNNSWENRSWIDKIVHC